MHVNIESKKEPHKQRQQPRAVERLHAGLYVCEREVYLAVVYQHSLLVRGVGMVLVVGVVVVELRLGHLELIRAALLRVEAVQLVLGEVVHDARAVRVAHHVHRRAEAVPASLRGEDQYKSLNDYPY